MAIAFDAKTQLSPDWTPASSYTWSHTVTGSNTLLVGWYFGSNFAGGTQASSFTWNGTSMTALSSVKTGGGGFAQPYYLLGAATGTHNAVISHSTATFTAAVVSSYSGVKQSGFPDNSNYAQTDQTAANFSTTAMTPNSDNCWLLCFLQNIDGGVVATGTTEDASGGTASTTIARSTSAISPASSKQLSYTGGSRYFNIFTISIAPNPAPIAYTLTAALGTYALSGVAALFSLGHVIVAAKGTYLLTGVSAAFKKTLRVVAAAGSYTLSGVNAAFHLSYTMVASVGSYTLTGLIARFSLIYTALVKHSTSYTGGTKHSTSYTPGTKDSTSYTPIDRSNPR